MPPKARGKDEDLAQVEVLQAVVLADSFNANFRPVTFEMPKVLLPLANVPMIEYTLEFLAAGGVQEIFIFCNAHADEVERYIERSGLQRRLATVVLRVLKAHGECASQGDALREVEARGVIKSDFVLVPGDVVANISLAPLIAAHKARREIDREAVLTTVMSRVPVGHQARRGGEEKLVALSGETGRLLMYEEVKRTEPKVQLPMELFSQTDRFELHRDLYDTHIDICTVELLTLIQDNFDWQDLRRDVLPGILGQFEMLGKTMYSHVLTTEYAARVHDPHTYDVVSRDIMQRWTFPLVPDANLLPGCTYRCTAHCVYEESGVALARSATLLRDVVVGGSSKVGERSTVEASVIGRGCTLGEGVTVVGSYLWSNVTVEDGATLTECICCEGVVIGRGAMIPPGTVLGRGVRVGAGCTLPRFGRFWAPSSSTLQTEVEEEEDYEEEEDDEEDAPGVTVGAFTEATARRNSLSATAELLGKGGREGRLGPDGVGRLWRVVPTPASLGFDRAAIDSVCADELSEEEEEEFEEEDDEAEDADFAEEVGDTVSNALGAAARDAEIDNLALEINSLKFAQNRTFADCVLAIVPRMLDDAAGAATKKAKVAALKQVFGRWAPLLPRFVQSQKDQRALVAGVVDACRANESLVEVFDHALKLLYDRDDDMLNEGAILSWAGEAEGRRSAGSLEDRLLTQAKGLLEWLREDEEDEEDEDDDEEEEEEEEE